MQNGGATKKLISGLWLRLLDPDKEDELLARDCEYCKRYWHYSEYHDDEKKRGKPVLRNGKPQPWPRDLVPDCDGCGKRQIWTAENRRLYARVQEWRAAMGQIEVLRAWGWNDDQITHPEFREALILIAETERRIEPVRMMKMQMQMFSSRGAKQ